MKIQHYTYLLLLFVVLGCSSEEHGKKIGFIENIKVFEEFEMKRDYDKRIVNDIKVEAGMLDSIEVIASNLSHSSDSMAIYRLQRDYEIAKQQYERKFNELSSTYTKEVNDRLNEYLKVYAQENGYSMILGSGGQGNVMFVDDASNLTNKIIAFINKKYSE